MKNPIFEEHTALPEASQISPGEIILGIFEGYDHSGKPLVNFNENLSSDPIVALSTISLNNQHRGRQVALLFADGDISRPVIMGMIHNPLHQMIEEFEVTPDAQTQADSEADHKLGHQQHAHVDGKRVVFEAEHEIIFKCGDASITLTRAGKILIRGKYILTRSAGVNRIMGGSVQVN